MTPSTQPASPHPTVLVAQVVAPPEPRWLVLVMLFVLMGALAVPLLWRSPHFSPTAKRWLTVLAFIQTAVVLAILVLVGCWFYKLVAAAWTSR